MENHFISLALDSDLMAGKERMSKFTIAKATEIRSYVDSRKLAELLKARVDEHWNWEPRVLKDGRFIIECPSADTTRQIEKAGPMVSPAITLTFTPWTTDLYRPAKAEGALRWVIVCNLPMFCWDRNSMARMLKPTGDLVHIGDRSSTATEDVRVFLRLRRPQLLPCAIHCSISTLQHTYILELEQGHPPLPWDPRRGTEQTNDTSGEPTENPNGRLQPNQTKTPATGLEKGKAPMSVLQDPPTKTPARPERGRQNEIIIRERPPSPSTQ
ncbi:hypothetical protein J5N97_019436 [Dioscorea zingiberensis]|uniref:DUF4283 domain-containing protein n=1 Tax=Dioscorea zingiberensis TaxID=325984 RepID=A0A9D5HCQ1_9LILI|nr:hypothetical protein J5N97_019436 [Dioscorea zingiberensis]